MGVSFVKAQRLALVGRKVGMTQVFDDEENVIPVTVIQVGPCTVLQVKSADGADGYSSLQIGFNDVAKNVKKPQQGLFNKIGVAAQKTIKEIPAVEPSQIGRVPLRSEVGGTVEYADLVAGENMIETPVSKTKKVVRIVAEAKAVEAEEAEAAEEGDEGAEEAQSGSALNPRILVKDSSGAVKGEYALPAGSSIEVSEGQTVSDGEIVAFVTPEEGSVEEIAPGMQLTVDLFKEVDKVDVSGLTKGRGFQGTVKRHGWGTGDKSHGSKNVRMVGTTGMGTDPGRVWKGQAMPGHMGQSRRKIRALKVIKVDSSRNLLLVKGSVPGADGDLVIVQESFCK